MRAFFDGRLTTPLAEQNLVNGVLEESVGIEGEAVIVPGDLMRSVAYRRANIADNSRSMPPLAKTLVDEPGVKVLACWIDWLATGIESADCGGPAATVPGEGGGGNGGADTGGGAVGPGMTPGGGGQLDGTGGTTSGGGPTPETGDSGCDCATVGGQSPRSPWAWLLGGLAMAAGARRRRQTMLSSSILEARSSR